MGIQRLRWEGSLQFEGRDSWDHRVAIGGEPDGVGAKPSDLLPLSVAACTAYDLVNILRKQRQDLRGMEARVESRQDSRAPWTFRGIAVRFVVTGDVDPAKAERALALAEKNCSVAASIKGCVPLEISIEVRPKR